MDEWATRGMGCPKAHGARTRAHTAQTHTDAHTHRHTNTHRLTQSPIALMKARSVQSDHHERDRTQAQAGGRAGAPSRRTWDAKSRVPGSMAGGAEGAEGG